MPHYVSSEVSSQEDEILPDAPAHLLVDKGENGSNEGGLLSEDHSKRDKKAAEIKLEELFHTDDEEDEEFPTSSAPSGKVESSSPPLAPMYGYPAVLSYLDQTAY